MPTKSSAAPRTVRDAIRWTQKRLDAAGVYCGHGTDNTLDEAAWLVGAALRLAPARLEAALARPLTAAACARMEALLTQRIATRKPLAYLLKEGWFAGLPFYVDERVIVPRSLTGEFIQERFALWIDPTRVHRILDLCTGSGCMAIACAVAFPHARVDAADLSDDALAVARINVARHKLGRRVRLVRSDLFSALADKRYDIIVTNPPYVAHAELAQLPAEYGFEPSLALASGTQGLDAILRILAEAASHLNAGGILVAEVGNSRVALERALPAAPFLWLSTSSGDESVFLLTQTELSTDPQRFVPTPRARSKRAR